MAILQELAADAPENDETLVENEAETSRDTLVDEHEQPIDASSAASEWILDDSDSDDLGLDEEEPNAQMLYEQVEDAKLSESVESKLDLVIWSMPFVFLFELLNIVIRQQYHIEVTLQDEAVGVVTRLPLLVMLIWWTLHERRRWLLQSVLFVLGTIAGGQFIYIVNETPALGTLWIFCVVKLDLVLACTSLALIGAYIRYQGLQLLF